MVSYRVYVTDQQKQSDKKKIEINKKSWNFYLHIIYIE